MHKQRNSKGRSVGEKYRFNRFYTGLLLKNLRFSRRAPRPGAIVDEGNGYESAIVNFRFLANSVWTTDEAVEAIEESRATVAA